MDNRGQSPGLNDASIDEHVVRIDDSVEHGVRGCCHERSPVDLCRMHMRESKAAQSVAKLPGVEVGQSRQRKLSVLRMIMGGMNCCWLCCGKKGA
jgi:hypothetical protein